MGKAPSVMSHYRSGALIVAAGAGLRMEGKDKILTPLAGKPVLAWVVEVFEACHLVDEVVIVLGEENLSTGKNMVVQAGWRKVTHVCPGGLRRQDSVWAGMQKLGPCDLVVIHDGARPCLTIDLVERGLSEAVIAGAAIAAVPVIDTIKRVNSSGEVIQTLDRPGLWSVQTPQVFKADILKNAYKKGEGDVTDDASLVERSGHKVKVYMGSYQNVKITTQEDLALAEAILLQRK